MALRATDRPTEQMVAQPVPAVPHAHAHEAPDDGKHAGLETDELVMVLFPRSTWDAVVALAADLGVLPGETMGIALQRLREQIGGGR